MSNNIHFSCICGIDIAKKVMQVFKVTSDGVVTNTSVSRKDFLEHFRNIPPALIGMEACATSQHWGRELQGLGHTVKLLSPKAVKPYVKGLKNDRNDAEGIYRALIMGVREVSIKSTAVRDLSLLQTMRAKRQRDKVATINHIRGILAEYGLVMGKSVRAFLSNAGGNREEGSAVTREQKESETTSQLVISELEKLLKEVKEIVSRIEELESSIKKIASENKNYDLFRSAPGVGPITAAMMVVLLCNPTVFKNGRDFAAYLGLAPMSFGSGGRNQVTGIPSKYRCHNEARSLLVQCAHSITRLKYKSDWVASILSRKPKKVAIIAIANKLARQLWVMAKKGDKFEKRLVLAAV